MSDSKDQVIQLTSFEASAPVTTAKNSNTNNQSTFSRFASTFKRQPVQYDEAYLASLKDDYQRRNYILAHQPLKQRLKQRHLQMISIGGTLGSGLFIGLGYTLSSGPGATLVGFCLVGFAIFCVVHAAAELSVAYPTSGSFATHVSRFLDPAIGFTVASNYALAWLISFPSELIGCALTIRYWSAINPVAWVAIFYVLVVLLNLFRVRAYGESEFILSIIKVIAITIFIIIGIVIICGGAPGNTNGYIGTQYWHNPGSFAKPVFKSICNTFISAAFSFGGTELVILTAAESTSPTAITRATKQVFWRIALFYITTIVVIGCLVPYTDERLLGGSNDSDITASPFVIALSNTGSKFGSQVSNFMNVVILVAVISVANSCVYASSRVIQSLEAAGQLPEICAYIDKEGRPLVGILISFVVGLLCFVVGSSNESEVFNWFFSLCSISSFFTWSSICFSHVRFRLALRAQGRSVEELGFKAQLGIWGSVAGCVLTTLLIVGEIYISIFPLGSKPSAKAFFQYCLSIPLMLVVWAGYRIGTGRTWSSVYIKLKDIDLDTGKRYEDVDLLKQNLAEEKTKLKSKPWWYRVYRLWC